MYNYKEWSSFFTKRSSTGRKKQNKSGPKLAALIWGLLTIPAHTHEFRILPIGYGPGPITHPGVILTLLRKLNYATKIDLGKKKDEPSFIIPDQIYTSPRTISFLAGSRFPFVHTIIANSRWISWRSSIKRFERCEFPPPSYLSIYNP